MGCEVPCGDCSNDCGVADMEDYERELAELQERTKEVEARLARLGATRAGAGAGADKPKPKPKQLRSSDWFTRKDDLTISALYVERYLNSGITREELVSGRPIIGIAQSGSDIAPCNRHHLELAKRVREGIRSAGGVALEFPMHPIQESTRRPTATLDRNLAYLGLVELMHAYPFDGVVMLTGCDKTAPACLMAAATVNIPTICLNVGPMLNGWVNGQRVGSGSVVWQARELHAAGYIADDEVADFVASGTPSPGHCNTMGTGEPIHSQRLFLSLPLADSGPWVSVHDERPR